MTVASLFSRLPGRVPAFPDAELAVLVAAVPARALDVGQSCTLKAPLPASVTTGRGTAESMLDRGAEVSVVFVGAEGRSRVSTNGMSAVVASSDLDAACAGTLRLCRASSLFLLYEHNRSDSIASSVPPGTPVSILRAGKVWAHMRAGAVQGYATVADIGAHCRSDDASALNEADSTGPATEIVERGEGPGVLFMPFLLEGGAAAGVADSLGEGLFERLSYYRPDVGRLAPTAERTGAWKQYLTHASERARAAGLAFALVGRVGPDDAAGAAKDAGLVVSVALVDSATGRTVKGVRARPGAGDVAHAWTEPVLLALVPLLPAAPGSRLPVDRSVTPARPTPAADAGPGPTTTVRTTGETWHTPWFANPWGWLTLGGAVAAGVGAGVVGNGVVTLNDAANATAPIDPQRQALRSQAWQQALVADALTGTAVVVGVGALVVFAAGVGVD
jgi:hypothetical protein